MSLSILVHCPHCHAEGNLADPALFGQAISCPVCQQVFVAPTPNAAAPDSPLPVPPVGDAVSASPIDAPSLNSIPSAPAAAEVPQPAPDVSAAGMAPISSDPSVAGSMEATVLLPPGALPPPAESAGNGPQPWAAGSIPTVVAVPIVANPLATTPTPPQAYSDAIATAPQTAGPDGVPITGAFAGQATGQPVFPAAGEDFIAPVGPAFDGPLPEFMAPPPPPGAAEVSFAQSLPEPVARGAVQPPKLPSKNVMRFAIGSVSLIVIVATVVFLMGDPLRKAGKDTKPKGEEEMNPIAKPFKPEAGDSMEDVFARLKASQAGGQSGKENK